MLIQDLEKKGLIKPPKWLADNTIYMVIGGSYLYGMAQENVSDYDLIGIAIPTKEDIFPHLRGEIVDFGRQKNRFEQYLQHHIIDKNAGSTGKEYDLTVFSIVKYFNLAMENNPNTLEILFAPQNCVIHNTQIGQLIRENRKMFLHKGLKYKYSGYSFSQKNRAISQEKTGKRKEVVDKYGYDLKAASHCIRLLNQGIEFLATGDLNIQSDAEMLKSIRRAEWSWEQICSYFEEKERQLEKLYTDSSLPYKPDEDKIKDLLIECLNMHYKDIDSNCVVIQNKEKLALNAIKEIIEKL